MAEVDLSGICHSDSDQTIEYRANQHGSSTPVLVAEPTNPQVQCPDDLALYAIEVSLHSDILAKYKSAYASDVIIPNNPIFST